MFDTWKRYLAHLVYYIITGNWDPVFKDTDTPYAKLNALADHIEFNKDKFSQRDRSKTIIGIGIDFSKSNMHGLAMTFRFSKIYGITVQDTVKLITCRFSALNCGIKHDFLPKEFDRVTPQIAIEVLRKLASKYQEKEFAKEVLAEA